MHNMTFGRKSGKSAVATEAFELQELIDRIRIQKTKDMLLMLSENLTDKTEIIQLMPGTWNTVLYKLDAPVDLPTFNYPTDHIVPKKINVPLDHFFGLVLGYCKESDTLFYWKPE